MSDHDRVNAPAADAARAAVGLICVVFALAMWARDISLRDDCEARGGVLVTAPGCGRRECVSAVSP